MIIDDLKKLVERFDENISYYKDTKNHYNEHSCRIEYIDPFLEMLGWDVANKKGLAPQYREVIAENYSTVTDRPDYSLTLRGVTKLFVEAKKPSVDISKDPAPAIQTRKYGWNAKHKIAILTNFEYLIIYDTTNVPVDSDSCVVARYKVYHYTDYVTNFNEIKNLISRDSVYNGEFDSFFDVAFSGAGHVTKPVDQYFLEQVNKWRLDLSNDLFSRAIPGSSYTNLDILNDVVQEFINQIVFLRICEDKNLPLYHSLQDNVKNKANFHAELEKMFREADKRYNSGMFSGNYIIFDLNNAIIEEIVMGLYYPQSPFLFNIIEPNMLGQMYEMFLTEELVLSGSKIELGKKKDCKNRSVVTTPTEIVKYMVSKTLDGLCAGKTPTDIKKLKIADIACGSGVFLGEVFSQLQEKCVEWYQQNDPGHLEIVIGSQFKLPLEEKKEILTSCIFGIDIDIHAVEVSKFSLLIKLIENETAPSVAASTKILPDLSKNIYHGNSLVDNALLHGITVSTDVLVQLTPFDWSKMGVTAGFDAIIGNPPYVNTSDMHKLLPRIEINDIYKKKYSTSFKQFDKYFIFIERAINYLRENGILCYIVPNKFFKIVAGKELRRLISQGGYLVSLDDFGDTQLFEDKTIYSSILLLCKSRQQKFQYSSVTSVATLWAGNTKNAITRNSIDLDEKPWRLTTDISFLTKWDRIEAHSTKLTKYVEIFNGIQTSAERPKPIYWFSNAEVSDEDDTYVYLIRNGKTYTIEKSILKPYFKPVTKSEKGLNSYSILKTDKRIIFPYDSNGDLIPLKIMTTCYKGTYAYLLDYYNVLVPKSVSPIGTRDVDRATANTWYKYGRSQGLSAFSNTEKLIVGILSKEPMYVYDNNDMLIASGGTAGYCAIRKKASSPYSLEYIQAWLTHPFTEKIISVIGSDFENGFVSRGTAVLKQLPFIELDFSRALHKKIHDDVTAKSKKIISINAMLAGTNLSKSERSIYGYRKDTLITEIQDMITEVYEFRV